MARYYVRSPPEQSTHRTTMSYSQLQSSMTAFAHAPLVPLSPLIARNHQGLLVQCPSELTSPPVHHTSQRFHGKRRRTSHSPAGHTRLRSISQIAIQSHTHCANTHQGFIDFLLQPFIQKLKCITLGLNSGQLSLDADQLRFGCRLCQSTYYKTHTHEEGCDSPAHLSLHLTSAV